jgi:hypothetical protein
VFENGDNTVIRNFGNHLYSDTAQETTIDILFNAIKNWEITLAEHVARMEDDRNAHKTLLGTSKRKELPG